MAGKPDKNLTETRNRALMATGVATLLVTALFLTLVQGFLIALSLAGICAVLARPLFDWFHRVLGGRTGLASGLTLIVCTLSVITPLILITYEAAVQAVEVFRDSDELLETLSEDVKELREGTLRWPDWLPFKDTLERAGPQIYAKAQQLMGSLASFFATSLSHLTNGTATFFLSLFTFLYAMFFFLPMNTTVFAQMLAYSGLPTDLQAKIDARIISVSRATIRGTFLIGIIQAILGGLSFWVVGIEGVMFWSVIMALLAAIPAVGAGLIVFGGAVYLGIEGEFAKALALAAWAALVVGSVDNILRPRLVGKDAGMSDLWVFVSILGGLGLFGAAGIILGPVCAGVFLTLWTEVGPDDPTPVETEDDT
ncbi:AI-2E family transporter [Shimia sp. SDUM112013]|uniref:AI-2E family transporter n=1 Tax=Shimia sp. SDUM112013 TaxID=3136160 RepID=UPI0032EDE1D4